MSDYLGNLIARTVSPAVAVRPQLPSLFEPAPGTRETTSGPEFEQESFVERSPVTEPSEKLAPMPLSIPTPPQSMLREPRQTAPEISSVKKIFKVTQEPEPVPSATSIPESVRPRIFPRTASTLREDALLNSMRSRSDIIKSPVLDVITPASHEVSSQQKTGPSQPAVALKPVVAPEPSERELPARPGLQAILPTIRQLPSVPPARKPKPEPAINVTIGRVEIRAVPAPVQQRAKPRPETVLSLEDYLRQRAKGVSR
jgi:hypothetical protein